jgi:pimeloyl-ACP methyl ester carboxylesterase
MITTSGPDLLELNGRLALRHRVRLVSGGSEIVVFGNGLGTEQSAWHDIVPALPPRFSALLFDFPGTSPLLPQGFDPENYCSLAPFADELLCLLAEIGVKRCRYVGHSVAGMIGVLAAIEHPALFEQLILLNSSPCYLNSVDYIGGFDRADLDGLLTTIATNYQGWVAGFAPSAIAADVPEAVQEFSSGLLRMRPDVTFRIARMIFESDLRHLLPRISVPTILVHSSDDIAVPKDVGHYLHDTIIGSKLLWIDAKGHLPHLSAPAVVRHALAGILAD